MKKSFLFYLMAFFLMTVSFQNCSPQAGLQFGIDSQTAYSVYGDLPENAKIVDLQAQESVEYPSTQVVLVVDNSATMKQSQEELAERIDSLLTTLANKKVSLHIFSTSQYISAIKNNYGTLKNGVETYVKSLADLSPSEPNAIMNAEFGPNLNPVVLNPTDSALVRQSTIDKIKKSILAMGVSGNDNESGLCGILQMAGRKPLFVNANEKVVFFVLTDEDNYAGGKHCRAEQVYNYERTQMLVYLQTQVSYSFTAQGYRDGVATAEETRPFSLMVYSVVKGSENLNGQVCHSEDEKMVQGRIKNLIGKTSGIGGVNFYFKNATLTDCHYKEIPVTYHFTKEEGLLDYCKNSYKNYSNALAYFASARTGISVNQPCLSSVQSVPRGLIRAKYYLDNATDIAPVFLSEMNESLGDKYFISVITNKEGQSCALKSGQSYGSVFQRMEKLNPAKVQTYSLCPGDEGYKTAFKRIAESISYVSQEFDIQVPDEMKIRDVLLIPKGQGTSSVQLTPDQYEFKNGKIKINAKLSDLDKLRVIIF
ncbi:hypothetical protein [Bdellovibrio bacteriovorus]|uniref:hypothetical protein n=1 Tax=Bdellovibrio bacteriovorus TaxID=959 RepID=UPI0035A952D7